jgi:hypothetical protein
MEPTAAGPSCGHELVRTRTVTPPDSVLPCRGYPKMCVPQDVRDEIQAA